MQCRLPLSIAYKNLIYEQYYPSSSLKDLAKGKYTRDSCHDINEIFSNISPTTWLKCNFVVTRVQRSRLEEGCSLIYVRTFVFRFQVPN